MGLAMLHSRGRAGVHAPEVSVEVYAGGGLAGTSIVGLPQAAVREARDRVRAALLACRFKWPDGRTIVHLGPAELPKEGSGFDLAIALGVLAASQQLPGKRLQRWELIGELALDGALRAVPGVLPAMLAAHAAGRRILVPAACSAEAGLAAEHCEGAEIYAAAHLLEVVGHFQGSQPLTPVAPPQAPQAPPGPHAAATPGADLSEVRGHAQALRALEIAAAGGHNLLFLGPPGSGKSMLARRLPGILPRLPREHALEAAAVRSVAGLEMRAPDFFAPPFRAPHHTASAVALVGGGGHPRPGEVSLAHRGVLFLDELPEFQRAVLEALREPLENGSITISRAARRADFPARFQLIAAMNPCPCGYLGDPSGRCRCSPETVRRYQSRISGPLLDRIDLHLQVGRVNLLAPAALPGPSSLEVAARVAAARERQLARQGDLNAWLPPEALRTHTPLDRTALRLLQQAVKRFDLSGRAQARVLKIARTIADLAVAEHPQAEHLGEALSLRCLDRTR